MLETSVCHNEPGLTVSQVGNIVIADVGGPTDAGHMRAIRACYERALRKTPTIIGLSIIRPGTPVTRPDGLREAAAFVSAFGERVTCMPVILEDTGVPAQLLRTVVRGINSITRTRRLWLFESVDDALPAILDRVEPRTLADTALLLRLLQACREDYQPAA